MQVAEMSHYFILICTCITVLLHALKHCVPYIVLFSYFHNCIMEIQSRYLCVYCEVYVSVNTSLTGLHVNQCGLI